MGWSVTAEGLPENVMRLLGPQFERARADCDGHELKDVEDAARIITRRLKFVIGKKWKIRVRAYAGGSTFNPSVGPGGTSVCVETIER